MRDHLAPAAAAGQAAGTSRQGIAGAEARDGRWINEDTAMLLEAAGLDASHAPGVTPILLREPMAPHLAARHEGREITLEPILAAHRALDGDFIVVEGVGGYRVPLGPALDTVDLARALQWPVVLVVGMRLGCLNHALLTREAITAAGLPLAGWIANVVDPAMRSPDENIAALDERLGAPRLARLDWRPGATAREFARDLDVGPLL